MAEFDPLTISEAELKELTPADRAKVYKARAAARGQGGPPAAAAGGAPAPARPAAPSPAAPSPAAAGSAAASPAAPSPVAPGSAAPGRAAPGSAAAGSAAPAAAPAPAAKPAPPPEPEKPKEPLFVQHLLEHIPGATWQWRHDYAEIKIPSDHLLDAARALYADGLDYLSFITEVDWQDRLELLYHLFSYDFRSQPLGVILRTDLVREGMPAIASVTSVWPGAEFMEREAFEMMGIRFLGHPDLRRILLPDDFVGFPMRRDFEIDFEYITVKQLVHESD